MLNRCAKFHGDSPSGKKLNSISRERLNFRRRPLLCTTLYRNLMQATNFGGTFDKLFLWIFSWNFHRRCLSSSEATFVAMNMMNKCAKFHKDSPSGQTPERDWIFGDGRVCVQLCKETLCKRATSVALLTNFSFKFLYAIFTEDASLLLLYHGAIKSKRTKNSNQGVLP